jgi:tungstate transport system substrate-binding protein
MLPNRSHFTALAAIALLAACPAAAQNRMIVVALATSVQNSGLFEYLLPKFKSRSGIDVKLLVQGSSQALDSGRHGGADVVLVHARTQEDKFVAEGYGLKRFPVMYNDYVLVGPKNDPARARGSDIVAALRAIRDSAAPFVSHSDRSGTNSPEFDLWQEAGIDIAHEKGAWYKAAGQGTAAALNTASVMSAYTLSDRADWIEAKNKGDLVILVEGDRRLCNQYGVILVNPAKQPKVKRLLGQAFIDWLISIDGQNAIANFKIDGQQMFFPDANVPGA